MKARRLKTNQSWDEYRTHLKAYKKEIKDSKRKSWKTFCESASSVPENARIYKILKSTGKPGQTIGPVYKNSESKTLTESPAETLETLIKHHFKTDQETEVLEGSSNPINKSNGDTLIDLIYNQQRLSEVIKTLEPLKAPGPDGIQAILLKQSPDIVGRAMINLYKASHILGHIPKVLRETTGILIPKYLKYFGISKYLKHVQCSDELISAGIKSSPYHAGLTDNHRSSIQRQWMDDEIQVM